ncbi:MAG: RHS repeat protein, partial [bacterium]|nr:RHS repeat protein [bacterium]
TVTYDTDDIVTNLSHDDAAVTFARPAGMVTVTDPRNNDIIFTHDDDGHALTVVEGPENDPITTTFTYTTKNGLIDTVSYPEGNSIDYDYDNTNEEIRARGNVLTIKEYPGVRGADDETVRTTTFTYENFYNQVVSVAYPNSLSVTNSDPDDHGNFKTISTNVPGINYGFDFNKYGQITSETDVLGMKTTYNYHPEKSPGGSEGTPDTRKLDTKGGGYIKEISTKHTDATQVTTQTFKAYDKRGNLQTYVNSSGIEAQYVFSDHDELQTESIKSNNNASLSPMNYTANYPDYDNNGNLKTMNTTFGSSSNSYQYTYTKRNMMETETEAARGLTTTYTYNKNDDIESISNGLDAISFTYTSRNLVETVSVGAGATISTSTFTYDGNGNIETYQGPFGHVTLYQYDGFDRMKQIDDPLGNKTIIDRANLGNMLTIKRLNAADEIIRQSVTVNDPLGRMSSYTVTVPGGDDKSYSYLYEDGGKKVTVMDELTRSWVVEKNDAGLVKKETDPAGNIIEYYYDYEEDKGNAGNMVRKVELEKKPDGTFETYETQYAYNALNKVEKIIDPQLNTETLFTYDERGNLTGSIDAEKNTIQHGYDDFGRKIRTRKYFKTVGTFIQTEFEYYANNLLWKIRDHKGNETVYEYDDQKRVTKITYPDASFTQYEYTDELIAETGKTHREV